MSEAAAPVETSSTPAAETAPAVAPDPAAAQAPATPLDTPLVAPKAEEPAPETKPEEPKAEEPKAEEKKVDEPEMRAEDYILDPLPEGMTRDDPLLNMFLDGAARGRLDNDSVKAIVASMAPEIQKHLVAPQNLWVEMNNTWKNDIMADPEIGGEKFATHTLPTIQAALEKFGADGIFEALHVTGAGNNPAIVRTLYRMGAQLTEAKTTPVTSTSPVAAPSRAAALYPSAKA